jgi:hypothetical protein
LFCSPAVSLRLGRNKFEGTIPTEIAQMTDLGTLHMPGNKFRGTIPTQLLDLSRLNTISLKENFLTGTIPEDFVDMPNLLTLELEYNDLQGQIRDKEFCKVFDLFVVDCDEVDCKCCKNENCCSDCEGHP